MRDEPIPRSAAPVAAPRARSRGPRLASLRSIAALMMREMSTTYGRSPGGYLWALLEPVAGLAVMAFAFTFLVRTPPLGTNFVLFFATGLLPLGMYQAVAGNVGNALRFSRPLLAYPAVSYLDAILARIAVAAMTQTLVLAVILTGIFLVWDLPLTLDIPIMADALIMAIALGVGVGLVNSFLSMLFPIWLTVWAVVNRPMFLISGVLFLPDALPAAVRELVYLNPVAHVVSRMREGVYANYDAVHVDRLYGYGIALGLTTLGLLLLYRRHNDLLEA